MHGFCRRFGFIVCMLGFGTLGCSKNPSEQDFTPNEAKAKALLESALNHRKNGGEVGAIPNTTPTIEVTDTKWKGGQKIKSYEILAEEPFSGSGARIFKVKLELADGKSEETKYAVVGINPVLIYRDEDYQKLSGAGK